MNQKRCRLTSSLVTSRHLASLEDNNKPFRQVERFGPLKSLCHRLDGGLPDQHIALHSKIWPRNMTKPTRAFAPAPGGTAALSVHDTELAHIAAWIGGGQSIERLLGGQALSQQSDPIYTKVRVDPGLGGYCSGSRANKGADSSNTWYRSRDRHTKHARSGAARRNRKGV
jgi:hypothetical protein